MGEAFSDLNKSRHWAFILHGYTYTIIYHIPLQGGQGYTYTIAGWTGLYIYHCRVDRVGIVEAAHAQGQLHPSRTPSDWC